MIQKQHKRYAVIVVLLYTNLIFIFSAYRPYLFVLLLFATHARFGYLAIMHHLALRDHLVANHPDFLIRNKSDRLNNLRLLKEYTDKDEQARNLEKAMKSAATMVLIMFPINLILIILTFLF